MPIILDAISLKQIRELLYSRDLPFDAMANIAGLNPKLDFQEQNLSYLNFGRADLCGYSFQGADLSFSDLEDCLMDSTTDLTNAVLVGTKLPPSYSEEDLERRVEILLLDIDDQLTLDIESQITSLNDDITCARVTGKQCEGAVRELSSGRDASPSVQKNKLIVVDRNLKYFDLLAQITRGKRILKRRDVPIYYISLMTTDNIMHGPFREGGFRPELLEDVKANSDAGATLRLIKRIIAR